MSLCELLRQKAKSCQVAVVAATDLEAAPLERALVAPTSLTAASKRVVLGSVAWFAGPDKGDPVGRAVTDRERAARVAVAVSGCDKANAAHMVTLLLECIKPRPALVIQVGVAGAFPGREGAPGPRVGDLVVASSEEYADTGSSSLEGWLSARELGLPIAALGGVELGGVFPLDANLVEKAAELIKARLAEDILTEAATDSTCGAAGEQGASLPRTPAVWVGPCITSSTVTGTKAKAKELVARFGPLAESMEGAAAAHICALYRVPFLEIRGISNLVEDRNRNTWQVDLAAQVAGKAVLAVLAALDELPLGSSIGWQSGELVVS